MKSLQTLVVLSIILATSFVQAQRPGGGRTQPSTSRQPSFAPPPFPLMEILDANGDHKLSAKEIANASAALAKLDKNKDGKLTNEEIGWPPSGGRPGGDPRGGFPGGGPGFGPPGGFGPGGFGFGPPGFESQQRGRPNPDAQRIQKQSSGSPFVSILLRLDKNKNGSVEKAEIPSRMRSKLLARFDKNKNGTIDKSEIDEFRTPSKPKEVDE